MAGRNQPKASLSSPAYTAHTPVESIAGPRDLASLTSTPQRLLMQLLMH